MNNESFAESFEVPIRDDSIRLGQLLKLAGLVQDGQEAKALIGDGLVRVDGEVETRRGRQVRPGSVVDCGDARVTVTGRTA